MIGVYKLKEDRLFRCGVSVFEVKEGAIIEIKQVDRDGRKVLIDFGGRDIDWFSDGCMVSLERVL